MALYPTCIRCLESVSDLDASGLCTRCSRDSKPTPLPKSTPAPENSTKVESQTTPPQGPNENSDTLTGKPFEQMSTLLGVPGGFPPSPSAERFNFRNYRDITFLDRGGMGVVYKAIQSGTERNVAIKTMTRQAERDQRNLKRFVTEVQALARVSHPGIVQIYEVDEDEATCFFSMEYLPGGSLAKKIKSGERPTVEQSVEIVAHVASALVAAHANQIVHRDIKPSNILLTAAGKPKLTDFGLACFAEEKQRMTQSGAVLGTPAYMAPEQADGKSVTVGPAADIYSLGATLYELLTGKPPFTAETALKTVQKVLQDKPVPPRSLNPAVPADVESICLRCLEKDPKDRYESASELSNDLFRVVRHEPIGKPSLARRVRKWVRQKKVPLAVTATLIGLTVTVATIAALMKPEDPKDKIARLIKAGKPFSLPLGPDGTPAYQAWPLSVPAKIGKVAEGVWGFQTNEGVYLELCPDTWFDSYEVQFEMRMTEVFSPSESRFGVYQLPSSSPPDPLKMMRITEVTLRDWPYPPSRIKLPRKMAAHISFVARGGDHEKPDVYTQYEVAGGIISDDSSKKWRRLTMNVSSQGMNVSFANTTTPDQPLLKMSIPAERLQSRPSNIHDDVAVSKHGGLTNVPDWHPRGRFGVYAQAASVEFRNIAFISHPAP